MNNIFSFRRFGLLFKKTLFERPVQLFGLTGLVLALVFFSYLVGKTLGGYEVAQNASFIVGIVGGGCFMASMVFSYFSSNAMGSSYLTLPASHFEKWLCGVLITGVLYVAIFLLFYRGMDSIFVALYHKSLDPKGPFYKYLYDQVTVFPFDSFVGNKGIIFFLNFAGAMLVGSLYFNKVSFIKVSLIVCVIWFGLFLVNFMIAKTMIPDTENAVPYIQTFINVGDRQTGVIALPPDFQNGISFVFKYCLPAALWLLSWQRFREKEF